MGIPEIYIKMCERAEEIQKLKARYQIDSGNYDPRIRYTKEDVWWESNTTWEQPKHIWLPHQDQLQEMLLSSKYKRVEGIHSGACAMWDNFGVWLENAFGNECWDYSGEQLWLAFVMKEKYSKVWNGTDWVKID